jgi:stage V sporulation protein SpoVS
MRSHHRFIWALGLAVALFVATCKFPTDKSDEVYVTIEAPTQVVLDGDEMSVQARAWRRVGTPDSGNGDDEAIANVDFAWTTSAGAVAGVQEDASGYATIQGIGPGTADITARAVAFESAAPSTLPVRVSGFLEIDSVTPPFIKWGDKITLWGVGIRFAFAVSLPGGALIPDTLTYTESQGLSSMQFWVPQPTRTDRLFVLGPGIFFNTPDSIAVDTVDLYEPNTTAPTLLSLDGPGPYPTVPSLLFVNPALAFEELPRDTLVGYDWYRFTHSDSSRAMTFILRPQGNTDSSGLFTVLSDSIVFSGGGHGPGTIGFTWFITSEGFYVCPRGGFSPNMLRSDSMILALRTQPRYVAGNTGFHVLNFYGQRLNYAMVALDGYLTSDSRIQPDRFEENDICNMADDPAKRVNVGIGALNQFVDTLTIDNPHDIDWIRFHVNPVLATDSTTIRVRSRPFGPSFDRTDIDLYVVDTSLFSLGSVSDVGSRDSMRLALPTGDYYLVVVDYVGEATRYSLCISVRASCVPPIFPGEAVPQSSHRAPSRLRGSGPDARRLDGRPFSVPASSLGTSLRSPFRRP